jgi:hypothetical protein
MARAAHRDRELAMPDPAHLREVPLHGGNQAAGIVRAGDTVRRPAQPWSPAVNALLDHLATAAPGIAPRPLGRDDQDRDIFTFEAGETGHYPLSAAMRSDASLVAAARLLRRYHDATIALTGGGELPWQYRDADPARHEVICHSDVAPYNVIYRDGLPAVLIDFDHAGPGPRLRDVAYAVYRFAPLASDQSCRDFGWETPPDRTARVRAFLDAYGTFDADGLVEMAERRIRDLRDDILHLAETDPERVRTHLAEDHVGSYNGDLAWIAANRDALQAVVSPT